MGMELTTQSLYGWGRTAPSTAQVLSTADVDTIAPVSYTHLTLPTKA